MKTVELELTGGIISADGAGAGDAGQDITLSAGSGNVTYGDGGNIILTAGAAVLSPGTQEVDVGGAKGGGDTPGPANDATVYTAAVVIDGGSSQPIAVTGSAIQTYTALLSELNTDTTGATWSLTNGNLLLTSDTPGLSSSVAITDTDLFSSLTDYVAINAAVPGAGSDGAIVIPQTAAPASTTNKLYNDGGTLTWDGTDISAASGDVFKVGTPVNNQLAVWTGDGTLEGDSELTYDSTSKVFTIAATAGCVVTNPNGTLTIVDNNEVSPNGSPKVYFNSSGGTKGRVGFQIDDRDIELTSYIGEVILWPGLTSGDQTVHIRQGGLKFTERADHPATPSAGSGQLWIRNDTPNSLVFTDDAGTDHIISAAGGISHVVEDTTPQLGGNLDVNGFSIGDGTLELITFTETGSAVNQINIANAATATAPVISAAGGDANVDISIQPKGTGDVVLGNFTFDGDQTVGAGQDNFALTYDNGTGLISLEAVPPATVTKVGTTFDNRLAVWTGDGTIESQNNLHWNTNQGFFDMDGLTPRAKNSAGALHLQDTSGAATPRLIFATGTGLFVGTELGKITYDLGELVWQNLVGPLRMEPGFTSGSKHVELVEGGFVFNERADHVTTFPAAGKGELWVRSDTPNELIFTDDAGTDHNLTAGGIFTETGTNNIHSGTFTGTGDHNFMALDAAGDSLTLGSDNILIGENAGTALTTASDNVFIGRDSGLSNQTSGTNIAIGFESMRDATFSTGTVSIGYQAGRAITSGDNCIAIGTEALGNVSGTITGDSNIAIGRRAMSAVVSAIIGNIAIGESTFGSLTTGDYNVVVGYQAGNVVSTGSNNTFIGRTSGATASGASSSNVMIGHGAGLGSTGVQNNQLVINTSGSDDPLIGGDFSTGNVTIGATLRLKERADHILTPTATYGELWLRTSDSHLIFTDGSGVDNDLIGGGGISNVVEDTTPQLGGNLDVNGFDIESINGGDITLSPGVGVFTAGTQEVDVGGTRVGGDVTGLTNDATVYTASIVVDGGSSQPIAVTGSAAQSYTTLLSELNTDTTGAVWSLVGGNLLLTSSSTGVTSTIAITDTDLFSTLTTFVAVNAAVAGTGSDGAIVITDTAAPTGTTANKLYSVAGALTWNGTDLTAAVAPYNEAFDNSDLTAGVLTVTHSLGRKFVQVAVYDNTDVLIQPDTVTATSTTVTTIDLSSFGTLTGTWNVVII